MKLTTKSRYGTRAMVDIALNCDAGPVSLKDLSRRQNVSVKYLEQITTALKAAGLIRSIRGSSGGYMLAKGARDIKLLDIIHALEGSLSPVDCVDTPGMCPRINECAAYEMWCEVRDAIDGVLGSRTLEDLANRQQQLHTKSM